MSILVASRKGCLIPLPVSCGARCVTKREDKYMWSLKDNIQCHNVIITNNHKSTDENFDGCTADRMEEGGRVVDVNLKCYAFSNEKIDL